MLSAWMRLVRRVRPWMVAIALAGAAAVGGSSCQSSGNSADADDCCNVEYGPPTCHSDEDCAYFGPGWVCGPGWWCQPAAVADADADVDADVRTDDAADDGWTAEYGPPTCYSDEDCAYMGAGWICSPAGTCEWSPTADADADADVVEEDVSDDVDVEAGSDVLLDVADVEGDGDAEPDGPDDGSGIPDA